MVTVYTTNSCAFCPMVKKFLTIKNIAYQEVDVTNDQATRTMLLQKTGMQQVPVTMNGDNFVVGYNPARLAQIA